MGLGTSTTGNISENVTNYKNIKPKIKVPKLDLAELTSLDYKNRRSVRTPAAAFATTTTATPAAAATTAAAAITTLEAGA